MNAIINKKQVKAMLKVLNEQKKVRPTLSNVKVNVNDEYVTLIFTDSYMLVEMTFSNNGSIMNNDNLFISYEDLNVWYKLATAKSNLIDDLDKLVKSTKSWHDYPDIEKAKNGFAGSEQKTSVRVNSSFLVTACELFNNEPMNIKLFNMVIIASNKVNDVTIDILLLGMKEV